MISHHHERVRTIDQNDWQILLPYHYTLEKGKVELLKLTAVFFNESYHGVILYEQEPKS